jgi:hypothetical protein
MSMMSSAGAERCAVEVLAYIECLLILPETKDRSALEVLELVHSKLLRIKEDAESGWY